MPLVCRIDTNQNDAQDPGEQPFANSFVIVKSQNGTLLASLPTDSTGQFNASVPFLNQQLALYTPDGTLIVTFATDPYGAATVNAPIAQSQSTISGDVWMDADKNGVRDPAAELPYANQPVTIQFSNGTILVTVTTNSSGGFSVSVGRYPGATLIAATLDGTTKSVTTDSAGNAQMLVPILPAPPIQGTIWFDSNRNGVQDSTELDFAGPDIDLNFNNGSLLARTQINATGGFSYPGSLSYANLPISIVSPNGTVLKTFSVDGSGGANVLVPLAPPAGSIQGLLCSDINENGVCNPTDPPLGSSPVTIRWANGTVLAQLTTNSTGGYVLSTGPYPSTQFIAEGPQGMPKVSFTTDPLGNGGANVAVAPSKTTSVTSTSTSTSASTTRTATTSTPVAFITGNIWMDTNNNRIIDGGEGYANQPMLIRWSNGTILASFVTNSSGGFQLQTVVPYPSTPFTLSSPDGQLIWPFTTDSTGGAALSARIPPTTTTTTATTTSASTTTRTATTTSISASTTRTATTSTAVALIVGNFFMDANNNGVLDPGEGGYANQPMIIRWANGTVLANVVTNSSGGFQLQTTVPFPSTPFTLATADGSLTWSFTTDSTGSAALLARIPPPTTTTSRTSTSTTLTSTTTTLAVLNGTVFIDFNKDGTFTFGTDQMLSNETVVLLSSNGSVYAHGTTLPDGTFSILASPPAPNENLTVVVASDPTSAGGVISTDLNGGGSTNVALSPPTISGNLFVDMDSDRALSAADTLLPLEPLLLLFANGSFYANTTTLQDGSFILDPALPWAPNENLTIVRAADPGTLLANFVTSSMGAGSADVPVPIPTITGQLWFGA